MCALLNSVQFQLNYIQWENQLREFFGSAINGQEQEITFAFSLGLLQMHNRPSL